MSAYHYFHIHLFFITKPDLQWNKSVDDQALNSPCCIFSFCHVMPVHVHETDEPVWKVNSNAASGNVCSLCNCIQQLFPNPPKQTENYSSHTAE